MAIYYYLAVGCADESGARTVSAHFDGITLALADGLSILCSSYLHRDPEGACWSITRPYGAGHNATGLDGRPEPNLATGTQRMEIGRLLYDRLLTAPDFRYALFGAEALDNFFDAHSTYNAVLREPAMIAPGWAGLVVDESFWEQSGRPAAYERFRPGYYWVPWPGVATL
jgi:hypothetical protein